MQRAPFRARRWRCRSGGRKAPGETTVYIGARSVEGLMNGGVHMRSPRSALAVAAVLIAAPLAAGAQELLPPQPGLTVKFRFTATHGAAQPESTFRVVAVDGFRTTAEVDRATNPPERYTLHSYRIWYSERVVQPHGTLHQESPTRFVD